MQRRRNLPKKSLKQENVGSFRCVSRSGTDPKPPPSRLRCYFWLRHTLFFVRNRGEDAVSWVSKVRVTVSNLVWLGTLPYVRSCEHFGLSNLCRVAITDAETVVVVVVVIVALSLINLETCAGDGQPRRRVSKIASREGILNPLS